MYPSTAILVGSILAVAATVALFVLVLPEKKEGHLSKYLQLLRDIFTFQHLVVEKILQVLYVLSTCLAVFIGFFMLFARTMYWHYSAGIALQGLCLMVLGPIVLRVLYELLMLAVLQVKHTMEINRKLGNLLQGSGDGIPQAEAPVPPTEGQPVPPPEREPEAREASPAAPVPQEVPGTRISEASQTSRPMGGMRHCRSCGTWYQVSRDTCPICGKPYTDEENRPAP